MARSFQHPSSSEASASVPTADVPTSHGPQPHEQEFQQTYGQVVTLLDGMPHPRLLPGVAAMILVYSFPDGDWRYEPGTRVGVNELLRHTAARVQGFASDSDLQAAFREQLDVLSDLGGLKFQDGCWVIPEYPETIKAPLLRESIRLVNEVLARTQAQDLATASLRRSAHDSPTPNAPVSLRMEAVNPIDSRTMPFPAHIVDSLDQRALRRLRPVSDRILYCDPTPALEALTPEVLARYPLPDRSRQSSASTLLSPIRRYLLDCIINTMATLRPELDVRTFEAEPGTRHSASKFSVEVLEDGHALLISNRFSQDQLAVCERLVHVSHGENSLLYECSFPAPGDMTFKLKERSSMPASVGGALLKTAPQSPRLITCILSDDFHFMMRERSATAGLGRTFARDLRDNQNLVVVVDATATALLQAAESVLRRDPEYLSRRRTSSEPAGFAEHVATDALKLEGRSSRETSPALAKIYKFLDSSTAKLEALAIAREGEVLAERNRSMPNESVLSLGSLLSERSAYVHKSRRNIIMLMNDLRDEPFPHVAALVEHIIGMHDPFPLPATLLEFRRSPLGALCSPRIRMAALMSTLAESRKSPKFTPSIGAVAQTWNGILADELNRTSGPQGSPLVELLSLTPRKLGIKAR